jgi:hypothetical protein
VIQNHSHRAGADLGRELVGRLACHGSTFSGVGASDQPGAVQTDKYPSIIAALSHLKVKTAYLDGELCGVDEAGLPSFAIAGDFASGTQEYALAKDKAEVSYFAKLQPTFIYLIPGRQSSKRCYCHS